MAVTAPVTVTVMVVTDTVDTVMVVIIVVVVVESTAAVKVDTDTMQDTIMVDTKVVMTTDTNFTKNGVSAEVTKANAAAIMEVNIAEITITNTKDATAVTMDITVLVTGMKTTILVVADMEDTKQKILKRRVQGTDTGVTLL